ncbi:hypothetical protein KUCAC02_037042 [Chaenocephalus aceratus]|nr:hypothetical protein KUCAC02_037042 [Chaenocephalus aceratus]
MLQLFTFLLEKFSLLFNFELFGSSWSDGDNKVAHLIPDILPVLTLDRKLIGSVITNTGLIFGVICRCATDTKNSSQPLQKRARDDQQKPY